MNSEVEQPVEGLIVGVCVVGFHHTRGPEVEYWIGENGKDLSTRWANLPFQSLPDGSHSHEEDYSYFTLLYEPDEAETEKGNRPTTYFGISCNRQIRTTELLYKSADVTRSTVQKSVVVVARKPIFGPIREKLAVVTRAYFLQGNFEDRTIIDNLYENLVQLFHYGIGEVDLYNGMTLRELVYRFKWKTLVLFKALLLESKILFFGSNTELLCSSQFSLVSLIPGLIEHLDDSASPILDTYEYTLKKSNSLRSSDRTSLLAFMGLPLQVFGKGGMFNPYTPLQQLEALTREETKFYLIGSTNSLLLSQKHKFADIIVNVDDNTVEILNPNLEGPLHLTSYDRKWIDSIFHAVNETWPDEAEDAGRFDSVSFDGSEDYIRWQFEEYLMALLASVKYDGFLTKYGGPPPPEALLPQIDGNPAVDFNLDFVEKWKSTNNYRIFQQFTDEELFDVVEPRHLSSGGISLEDVQRKVAQQMQNLAPAREAIAKTFTTGSQRVSNAFGSFWAEIENMREKERIRRQTQRQAQPGEASSPSAAVKTDKPGSLSPSSQSSEASSTSASSRRTQHITVSTDPSYLSGWSRWASDKRRQAFGSHRSGSRKSSPTLDVTQEEPSPGVNRADLGRRTDGRAGKLETTASTPDKQESSEDEDEDMDGTDSYTITSEDINPWKADDDRRR
ncbi:transport protein Avl9-domain-containing protein [Lipomyces tetrasporus]